MNTKNTFKNIFHNSVFLYIISRYGTYFIQFINSLLIAQYLGPFYLGFWGFILMIIQYVSFINFGIPAAVNVIVSTHIKEDKYPSVVIGNGLSMMSLLSVFCVFFFYMNYVLDLGIGKKYMFNTYAPYVALIGITGFLNMFFSNIFRVYGNIKTIALYQSLFPFLSLIFVFFFREKELLWALIILNCFSSVVSLFIFIIKRPVSFKFRWDKKIIKKIQIKGWFLFIYNTSFVLIILSIRTIISSLYKIEEFGNFTFAYSLANAFLLLLNSISFLIFPKLIYKFSTYSNSDIEKILETIREAYVTFSHLLVHIIILLFPILLILLPKYQATFQVFGFSIFTVLLNAHSFGYSGLIMSRGHEKILGKISFMILIINILIAMLLTLVLKVPYSYVILASLVSYAIYALILAYYGRKEILLLNSFKDIISDVFPIRLVSPFLISILCIVFPTQILFFFIPLILFILLNKKNLLAVKDIILRIIHNPNLINII